MRGLPRFQLRTVLVLFACAAVGLAIGTAPTVEDDLNIIPDLNWHHALLGGASVCVVIGLLQQASQLRDWQPSDVQKRLGAKFGKRFAMLWRLSIAGLLVICLVAALLLDRNLATLPESDVYYSYAVFPYVIWVLCLVVVTIREWIEVARKK